MRNSERRIFVLAPEKKVRLHEVVGIIFVEPNLDLGAPPLAAI
jgi:hypothetical protein